MLEGGTMNQVLDDINFDNYVVIVNKFFNFIPATRDDSPLLTYYF